MRQSLANFDFVDAPPSRFDSVIEWLVISLLIFSPLAFGAVQAWSEEIVLALAAAISICFCLKLVLEENERIIWSWAYVPVAIFTLVAICQLIPFPTTLIDAVSPNTAAIRRELLADLPHSDELLRTMTFSLYPNATKHDLRLLFAVSAVFFVVVNVYRREEQIKQLLSAIAIIGGLIAGLAIAQDLFDNGKIYWIIPTGHGTAKAGTFVNHSHYGQFMNMSIGAALGLILVRVHEAFSGKKATPPDVFEYLGSPAGKRLWLLIFMVIMGATTVFVSLTRGGMVSMFIAAGFTVLVLSSRRSLKGQSWIMAVLALGAFICVLYVGFDAVYDRLASLREIHQAEGGRWQIVKDIASAWTKFPVLGTGLGTHAVVYPMFDRSTTAALAAYAENEYAQTAEETGIVGLAALVSLAVLLWLSYIRNIRSSSIPIRSAAYGLGFGLLAIMLHSLSDFGQHLPANALLSAVSCGILIGLARSGQKNIEAKAVTVPTGSRSLRITVLVCLSGCWIWILLSSNNARLAEAAWNRALAVEQTVAERDWQAGDAEYIDLISNAAAAARYQPENVKYQHWLNLYRWKSVSRITDPNGGAVVIPDKAIAFVDRIVDELNKARLLCPTYGASYCVIGQLEKFVMGDPNGADRIRKGFQLAPCDPTACYVAGLLDAEEQRYDASFEKMSRAIELDSTFFQTIVDMYIDRLSRPDIAVAIAGDDVGRLIYVANSLAGTEEHRDIVEKARIRVIELLEKRCSEPDAPASALASLAIIYGREENYEAAIEYYRRALALDYGQVQWRYARARLLKTVGKIPEAIQEARRCLRLSPQFKPAEKLIEELSILPEAAEKNPAI